MDDTRNALRTQVEAGLRRAFQPDKAGGVDSSIFFDLTGDDGFSFHALIQDGTLTFTDEPQKARVKMKMPVHDFLGMLDGTVSPNDAFLSGKLKVGGNMFHAMRLAPVFKFGPPRP